jgi:hypothetical protein
MEKGRCKHCRHEGMKVFCALGLDPDAIAKSATPPGQDYKLGLFLRMPCDTKEWTTALLTSGSRRMSEGQRQAVESKATCEKFEDPTDEEIAAYQIETTKLIADAAVVMTAVNDIKKKTRGSWGGTIKCPVCGGKLHVSIHAFERIEGPQKHAHVACETKECVRYME